MYNYRENCYEKSGHCDCGDKHPTKESHQPKCYKQDAGYEEYDEKPQYECEKRPPYEHQEKCAYEWCNKERHDCGKPCACACKEPELRKDCDCHKECPPREPQRHVHEFTGSVEIYEKCGKCHNHRFAGVSGQAILLPDGNHVHRLLTRTDFYEDHFHAICDTSGPAIPVGKGRHVHFAATQTSVEDGHCHKFVVTSLIENPIGD